MITQLTEGAVQGTYIGNSSYPLAAAGARAEYACACPFADVGRAQSPKILLDEKPLFISLMLSPPAIWGAEAQ